MTRIFPQYTIPELEVVARIDHALADEVFSLHRQGYDVREVLHEARAFKAEAQMMRREINRRKKSNSQGADHEH
jgi:hypothetical protein